MLFRFIRDDEQVFDVLDVTQQTDLENISETKIER